MKKVLLSLITMIAYGSIIAQISHSDCGTAFMVCSHDAIAIEELPGAGNIQELNNINCSNLNANETNSVWFKWKIETAGDLGFTILPVDENSDIDFVLYRMTDALNNCEAKEEIRCMASGENRGTKIGTSQYNCLGATGLSYISEDLSEKAGCSSEDDNFLSTINTLDGESYALVVNNYYSTKGFIIEFTGAATFNSKIEDCEVDVEQSVSIQDIHENKLVFGDLYPNPANNVITLGVKNNTSNTYGNARSILVNTKGQVVKEKGFDLGIGETKISMALDELPTGTYFIKTEIENNIHIARFVKI